MKRTILVGFAACALLGAGMGTAAADGLPLTDVDIISPGSAGDLGNAIGSGSVDAGSAAAGLGSAFSGGYLQGVLSSLSAH
ncbi:hypothetical protein D7D52_36830 [Nocardia yunnanensis]|uniref:Secreted protein n=1 Tax=Nocardia yunnanensis TaxID=2382165 RepID=A0A386ZLZ7_9NOCA|nr:hypothetical protein [Nocardia yunnanensis]AYF78476.1 hypothetical protein D7D52_36830 [Nocardia yunnanensis]